MSNTPSPQTIRVMTRYRSGIAVASASIALLLNGCASLPADMPVANTKALSAYQTDKTFDGKNTATRQWPNQAWWANYADPQLDALVEEGLKGSPDMAIASARLRQAAASIQVTRAESQAQLSARGSVTEQKQSYNYLTPPAFTPQGWKDYGQASLDFSWEIDFWGKNKAALAAATSNKDARTADVAQARLTLTTAIASAYGELARLYLSQDTATASHGIYIKNLALAKERNKYGLETIGAVRQAEALLAATEQEQLNVDEQITLQKHLIAALIGAGPDRGLSITRPQINIQTSQSVPANLGIDLIGRRPDIVAARSRVEAANSNIDKQKAAFYPNISLSAVLGVQSLGLSKLFSSGSDFGSIGPAFSLPILNGGRLRAQLEETAGASDEAVALYDKTLTQALQEVADALTRQNGVAQQLAKLQTAVDAAKDAYRVSLNRYQGGLANYIDVLSTEATLISNVRQLHDMQSRRFTQDIALIKALGGGYQQASQAQAKTSLRAQSAQ